MEVSLRSFSIWLARRVRIRRRQVDISSKGNGLPDPGIAKSILHDIQESARFYILSVTAILIDRRDWNAALSLASLSSKPRGLVLSSAANALEPPTIAFEAPTYS